MLSGTAAAAVFVTLFCVAAAGGRSLTQAQPTVASFVVAVNAQRGKNQPYPRSAQNKAIAIEVGSGAAATQYTFTVDTGSSLLELSCRSPTSLANCQGRTTLGRSYNLTAAKTVTSPAVCAATGVGCRVPATPTPQCCWSQGLTGGNGYNGHTGAFARDTVTVLGSSQRLSFRGIFACAESTYSCAESDEACRQGNSTCPATPAQLAGLLDGGCVGDGKGIEAGWTFGLGGAASAVAVPEQVYQSGLISQRVMGICWQRPQKDANCSAAITPNSAVVLGPALPSAVVSAAQLAAAPLYNVSVAPAGTAAASTQTFRTRATGAAVPTFSPTGSAQPWSTQFKASSNVSVLWDTGAYGQSIVPPSVFEPFLSYYTAARAKASAALNIQPCGAKATAICGGNLPSGPGTSYACQRIALATPTPQALATAQQALLSLYPPAINITLQGGAVASLPTAFALNDCAGPGFTAAAGVAVCSYVRQAPPGTGSNYFWLAGPWFHGRFTQFDLSPAAQAQFPGSVGAIRFSGPIPSCAFPGA